MWSLSDDVLWEAGWTVPLSQIWVDASYFFAPHLAQAVPDVAAIHPYNSAVVYFIQRHDSRVFTVDVPTKKVLNIGDPMVGMPSSRCIHTWELPPELHRQFHGT